MIEIITDWIKNIKATYNVNPWIFALIYIVCVPPFWFSLYKLIEDIRKGKTDRILRWLLLLGFSIIAPFLYVAIFGKNLPYWFWITVVIFIVLSVLSLIKNIRKKIK